MIELFWSLQVYRKKHWRKAMTIADSFLKQSADYYLTTCIFFGRRFSWKEPTIVMAFRQSFFIHFIFYTPDGTKKVLPKVIQNFTLPLLAKGTEPKTKKVSRVTYNTGRDQSFPLSVFSALWDFFRKKKFHKGKKGKNPSIFFWVLRQNGCWKIPKGKIPFSFFGIVSLFLNFFYSPKVPLQFFDVLQQWMLKISKGSSF